MWQSSAITRKMDVIELARTPTPFHWRHAAMKLSRASLRAILAGLSLLAAALPAWPESKFVSLDNFPLRYRLEVAPDGSKVYLSGSDYLEVDDQGTLLRKFAFSPWGTGPLNIIPLPDGWFIAGVRGLSGRIDLHRPDGSVAKTLVQVGGGVDHPHGDANWANPDGIAVDRQLKRIFLLDATKPPPPNTPDWSRIAMFDYTGKYVGDIARYDAAVPDAADHDDLRTTYNDIDVDPATQRIYVTSTRFREIRAYGYDGKLIAKVQSPVGNGSVAALRDGRVVAAAGGTICVYDHDLKQIATFQSPNLPEGGQLDIQSIKADDAGRLYATVSDHGVIYVRWSADFKQTDVFRTKYLRINVDFPGAAVTSGAPFVLKVQAAGNPEPQAQDWQVMTRPTNGSDLTWRPLPFVNQEGALSVTPPAEMNGLYEVAVRYGKGPIAWAARQNDPYVQKTIGFMPALASSVAIISSSGRTAFRQGEAIPLQIINRSGKPGPVPVDVLMFWDNGKDPGIQFLPPADLVVNQSQAVEIPASLTQRLLPGRYTIRTQAEGFQPYPLAIDIATSEPDSTMQRILYTEFGGGGTAVNSLSDMAERLSDIDDYASALARLGFTRETDRSVGAGSGDGPRAWRRDQLPAPLTGPGCAPPEYYGIPNGEAWPQERYRDIVTRYGISLDGMLMGHCDGVPCADETLMAKTTAIQRYLEWLDRYPSSYGLNYNDEMFFRSYGWSSTEEAALKAIIDEKFKDKPVADAYKYALSQMYDRFNAAAREVSPGLHLTTTPMWQYPAVEGSYAPTIYRGMTETYGHYMTEGQHVPWYAVHDTEFLRRPGLATMGVFDNGHNGSGGDIYARQAMQMLALGVQGVGVDLTNALGGTDHTYADPTGADAYRTANFLAKVYGPVFAECKPVRDGAVLYSYSQDITEKRNCLGTPHWERVYEMIGAGLMAGMPLSVVYEEDLTAGYLLDGAKPRFPMLFLVGQTVDLPPPVKAAIARYVRAGGRVFSDAASAALTIDPAAAPPMKPVKLVLDTWAGGTILRENLNNDSMWPLMQPVFEKLARDLKAAVGKYSPWPINGDDPWVAKACLDGGSIRYLMLATETSPYPRDAATTWASGDQYMRSYMPKILNVTFPAWKGVIYDVFDHQIVSPTLDGNRASIKADLRTFPGRLYALAPAPLGSPRLEAGLERDTLNYTVRILDRAGKPMAAQVPIRIRLVYPAPPILEPSWKTSFDIYRATDRNGVFSASLASPVPAGLFRLEVTELLGFNGSAVTLGSLPIESPLLVRRPDAEIQRQVQIRNLLKAAKAQGSLSLLAPNDKVLPAAQLDALAAALGKQGIKLSDLTTVPKDPASGVYLCVGIVEGNGNVGDILSQAQRRSLFTYPVSANVPGPGRGLVTALFSVRGWGENSIALVGGDAAGLGKAVQAFVDWLTPLTVRSGPTRPLPIPWVRVKGEPTPTPTIPALSEMVGIKLAGLAVTPDGKRLAVAASGYQRNLALVQDNGAQGNVLRTIRVGSGSTLGSLFISPDGGFFGASACEASTVGEAFHLVSSAAPAAPAPSQAVFAAFGQIPPFTHRFAASGDGNTVIAPGDCGVVCWKRAGGAWKEAWSIDYWKEFQKLDWPVDNSDERLPRFDAVIPTGADYALIVFAETTNNGWVVSEHKYGAWLAAVNLSDGTERWRFAIPIPDTLLFPTLHTSPSGAKVLLQVQKDSFGKETYRFYTLGADGKPAGMWDCKAAPVNVAVADGTGWVAEAYKDRLLEVRSADGLVVHNSLWKGADPVSICFAADGKSLYVADDADRLALVGEDGVIRWQADIGAVSHLAAAGDRVYAAGWDGRLRALSAEGKLIWTLDLTRSLLYSDPAKMVVAESTLDENTVIQAHRDPITTATVPAGKNLLGTDATTVTVGGTSGWLSGGKVNVKAEDLVNGQLDDVTEPWLPLSDVFYDSVTGRQVWVEVAFKQPTDVHSLTVYENIHHPESWPTDGLVQVWDDDQKRWRTAARGIFLHDPVTTYSFDLKQVTKIRYVPWSSYFRNFYTSEIEVR